MSRGIICQCVSDAMIAFKLFKSKLGSNNEEDRDCSQEPSPDKVLETGCKKRITVLHSRMHEHWEVIPRGVAWRHGRDKKASDKSNRRRTLMTKTTEETETGLTEPRRAIVQNLNQVRGSQEL